ncbi:MAG: hypothetical protein WD555_05785 [Fulvivirga sp.]
MKPSIFTMDLDDLNKELNSIQTLLNNAPKEEFDGRSPSDMFYLLHKPFDKDSPLQFRKQVDQDLLGRIPFLKLTIYYLRYIQEQGAVKLTQKGNMPVRLVKLLYEQKFVKHEYVERGLVKLSKEQDSYAIHTTRIIAELAGLTKKRNNKVSLTKKAEKLLDKNDRCQLFRELFIAYTMKFNWAYQDNYGDNPIGQLGFAFTLEQLIKHGATEKQDIFYGELYLKAFPGLLEFTGRIKFWTPEEELINCFASRTFTLFLDLFGLVKIREEGKFPDRKTYIRKAGLLDEVFLFD